MSKTLKRILSAALVLCMILAVLPATAPVAKAEAYQMAEGAQQVVYRFKNPGVNRPSDVTASNYKTLNDANGDPLNWYFLGSSSASNISWIDSSILYSMGYNVHHLALVIDVPEAGTYQLSLKADGNQHGTNKIHLIKGKVGEQDNIAEIGATNSYNDIPAYYNGTKGTDLLSAEFNTKVSLWTSGYTNIGMLGEATLEAGQYILIVQDGTRSSQSTAYLRLTELTLTKSDNMADALNMALQDAYTGKQQTVHLAADYNAVGGTANEEYGHIVFNKPSNGSYAVLDLNGKTLTAKTVDASMSGHIYDSTGGNGKVVADQKPILATNNGKVNNVINSTSGAMAYSGAHKGYYMVETAADTYKFYQPTVKAVTEAYNKYTDGDTTATTYTQGEDVACFAFNAKLPEEVLAAAKANPADVKVTMSWYVNKGKPTVTTFTEESVANWLNDNGASKAFYVNLKGLSKAEEGTIITCTPKITIDQVAYTFADIVLTTAAAA